MSAMGKGPPFAKGPAKDGAPRCVMALGFLVWRRVPQGLKPVGFGVAYSPTEVGSFPFVCGCWARGYDLFWGG